VTISEPPGRSSTTRHPAGWFVGRPRFHDERKTCEQYAFDPSERPNVGKRSRE
jgi:hypothetical protein